MIRRGRVAEDGRQAVSFYPPPELAGHIACVVGEFNDWDPTADPFVECGGVRVAHVDLPVGRYRFRYLTGNGQWFNEPGADDYQPNEYGGADGVLDLTRCPGDAAA